MRSESSDVRSMVSAVRERLSAVRELMKQELKGPTHEHPEGRDFGIVPGTKKPSLLQPGAQKIALMFQFVPTYSLERIDMVNGHREVHATCTLMQAASGRVVGQGAGSASTMESKHRYRGAGGKACPECGAMACVPSKKEFGGGYFCKAGSGGCGKAFKAGSSEAVTLDALPTTKQENADPADQYNTVSKMAQKRAFVAAVLTASAASEIFTQDIEDGSAAVDADRPPVAEPKARAAAAKPVAGVAAQEVQVTTGVLEGVLVSSGVNKTTKKPWKKWGLKVGSDVFGTFIAELGEAVEAWKGKVVVLQWKPDGDYKTVVDVGLAPATEPEAPPAGGVGIPAEDSLI
jgi:hypothetical protein